MARLSEAKLKANGPPVSPSQQRRPIRGVGVGLRTPHYSFIQDEKPDIAWFEVLIDNYLGKGGLPLYNLEQIRNHYPMTFHGVGMSLGSTDPLNKKYLKQLKQLMDRFEPAWVSDHLCWMSVGGHYAHDLLPLPYVEQAVHLAVEHIQQVQEFLGQRILVENVSSYLTYQHSTMEEWDFLQQVAEQADCDILLDINNIYVSASNHGFNAMDYINHTPTQRVREIHLAGYEDMGTHLLDTHAEAVHAPVWKLYQQAVDHFGPIPTLIEWDNHIPEFHILQAEAHKAAQYQQGIGRHVA